MGAGIVAGGSSVGMHFFYADLYLPLLLACSLSPSPHSFVSPSLPSPPLPSPFPLLLQQGPFWCAQDNVEIALSSCMKKPADISVTELVSITYSTSVTGTIDLPHNLKSDRVYLFSGTKDTVVNPGTTM